MPERADPIRRAARGTAAGVVVLSPLRRSSQWRYRGAGWPAWAGRPWRKSASRLAAGEGVEEAALHHGEVVGEDRARAVDVVQDAVAGSAGAGVGGAAEELLLHLGEVVGQDRAAAVGVAGQDVDAELEVAALRAVAGGEGRAGGPLAVEEQMQCVGRAHAAGGVGVQVEQELVPAKALR